MGGGKLRLCCNPALRSRRIGVERGKFYRRFSIGGGRVNAGSSDRSSTSRVWMKWTLPEAPVQVAHVDGVKTWVQGLHGQARVEKHHIIAQMSILTDEPVDAELAGWSNIRGRLAGERIDEGADKFIELRAQREPRTRKPPFDEGFGELETHQCSTYFFPNHAVAIEEWKLRHGRRLLNTIPALKFSGAADILEIKGISDEKAIEEQYYSGSRSKHSSTRFSRHQVGGLPLFRLAGFVASRLPKYEQAVLMNQKRLGIPSPEP
jgi:hypothetical protein